MAEWKTKPRVNEGRKEKEEWTVFVCCVSVQLCVSMCAYLIQGFCQECVASLPFPLWGRVVQEGRLHRKGNGLYQAADGGQHVLTLQKGTHDVLHTRWCTTVAFIRNVTQIAHNKCQLWGKFA